MNEPALAPPTTSSSDRGFFVFAGVFSAAALGLLAYVLLFNDAKAAGWDLRFMPAVNAGFNALSASLLVGALVAIKRGERRVHQLLNLSAFVSSALFLCGYLAYHAVHGDTKFQGAGAAKAVYLAVLASHVLLSIAVLPMVLTTFYFAWRQRFAAHRKLARFTWPVWMYVSVTGVAIFFMLRGSAPRM